MQAVNKAYIEQMLVHDEASGKFLHHRDVFTNPELFELEMKYIFESNWVYLAHENQIPEINDYFSTYIGRQPIFISRNKEGELNAFINACTHKGAQLCRYKRGNRSTFTCQFHGWTFDNSGKLLKVKDKGKGGYPEQFDCNGSHNLKKIARFASYKGFLFGSLSEDVVSLEEYLGETKVIIDQMTDPHPQGIEILKGSSSYLYQGNWKLQMENGADGYHVSTVHWNYAATMNRRKEDGTKAVDANGWSKSRGGVYGFKNGHILLWTCKLNPEVSPIYRHKEEIAKKFGEKKADFIVNRTRNLAIYPNVFLMDQFSTQIRVTRPISVNETEVTIYCWAPKGENAEERAIRIRQYEDFFNVSGMGTPDDLEEFRSCQLGYMGKELQYNDISRGAIHWINGPDDNAKEMGMNPLLSGIKPEDEGLYLTQHMYWKASLLDALDKENK